MRKISILLFCFMVWPLFAQASPGEQRLRIVNKGTADARLYYGDKPVFAFGPSHQGMLRDLGSGSDLDIYEWAQWAAQYKITNIRSYPPTRLGPSGPLRTFLPAGSNSKKLDLTKFNPEYFQELRRACEMLKDNGIIVHLQLWQSVGWKNNYWDRWDSNYYNPVNNVNSDISKNAGPGEFVTMKNPVLLAHQKEYVRHVLDATGDLGNVFYDIMNEIGNGVGKSERWVNEIIASVRQWEKENGHQVLLTLNDEGGMRMGEFSLSNPGLDLALKDLGRYDEHVQTRNKYKKPTIAVRNIDYNYATGKRTYFFGNNDLDRTSDSSLQSRGRRVWWRMFMALVQSNGGYSDVTHEQRKRDLQAEHAVLYFRDFVDSIQDYPALRLAPNVIAAAPGASAYGLQSNREVVIYCEAPSGRAGINYSAGLLKLKELKLKDGEHTAVIYDPATGTSWEETAAVQQGRTELELPKFTDDIAVHIVSQSEENAEEPVAEKPKDEPVVEDPKEADPGDNEDVKGDPSLGTGGESTDPISEPDDGGSGGGGGGGCTMNPEGTVGIELLLLTAALPLLMWRRRSRN
jgi:hypothetical protein